MLALREKIVVEARSAESSGEQEDSVIGVLGPGLVQHPTEMLSA